MCRSEAALVKLQVRYCSSADMRYPRVWRSQHPQTTSSFAVAEGRAALQPAAAQQPGRGQGHWGECGPARRPPLQQNPAWTLLCIGALAGFLGYGTLWLVVSGQIVPLPYWQILVIQCIGSNSATWFNTAGLVTCMRSFLHSHGIVVGILKGYVGLSAAIFTQIYTALLTDKCSITCCACVVLVTSVRLHKHNRLRNICLTDVTRTTQAQQVTEHLSYGCYKDYTSTTLLQVVTNTCFSLTLFSFCCSPTILQMFISCRGLPVFVGFLEPQYANSTYIFCEHRYSLMTLQSVYLHGCNIEKHQEIYIKSACAIHQQELELCSNNLRIRITTKFSIERSSYLS